MLQHDQIHTGGIGLLGQLAVDLGVGLDKDLAGQAEPPRSQQPHGPMMRRARDSFLFIL